MSIQIVRFDSKTRMEQVRSVKPLDFGHVEDATLSPDGHTLASGSGDGARLWNLRVQYAIDRICSTAGGLTARQWNEYIPQLRFQPSCTH